MTSQKKLKSAVRARMATTGERYAVARAHVVRAVGSTDDGTTHTGTDTDGGREPAPAGLSDHGYLLRGGTDPDAAALANLLAHRGVTGPDGPLPEALLLGICGGLGAGYILWEFKRHNTATVTLGFSHSWNYLDRRLGPAVERLGIDADWSRTGGAKAAAASLRSELEVGNPAIVWPDRFHVGYWHLPPALDGYGGHPVVAYAESNGRVYLDDRNLAPLSVDGEDLDRARARVGTYKNAMLVVRTSDTILDGGRLRSAAVAGLQEAFSHLSSMSDSFGLPAWRKWSRLLVDTRNAKAWPRVFADGNGLLGALLSVWEGAEPAGMTGGSLRAQFADFLDLTADLTGQRELSAEAGRWREIAGLWHELAEAAAPADVAPIAQARDLTAVVTGSVAEGDAGEADRAAAAAELWSLRAEHTAAPPFDAARQHAIFAQLSDVLAAIADAETAAVARLRDLSPA